MKSASPRYLAVLAFCTLTACGGGDGKGSAGHPVVPTQSTVILSAVQTQTLAGGKPLALVATASGDAPISWRLASNAPGTLSATTGTNVNYVPPPAPLISPVAVEVTASGGGGSQTLTLMVAPPPPPSGLSLIAGQRASLNDVDGNGASAAFFAPILLATDHLGTIYVGAARNTSPTSRVPLRLRKISPSGVVTTLAGNGQWFSQNDSAGNAATLAYPTSMAADRQGNLYITNGTEAGSLGQNSPGSVLYKISASGSMTVLAGSVDAQTGAQTDGKGNQARFLAPRIAGIDPDGNLFLNDANGKVRKVTPDGTVSTLGALPLWLNVDLNGNRYSADSNAGTVLQTAPSGQQTVVAGRSGCNVTTVPAQLPGCLETPSALIQLDAASYALLSGSQVVRLVVPH
jgi:hypothetical protein